MDAGNDHFPRPEALGPRIVVLGPTNSGKPTLAEALGMRLGVPAIHLDQLRHMPGTDWEQRPDPEFAALHDAAVAEPAWIMDGSYSALMPQRLARSLSRRRRAGGLEGGRDSVKWEMLAWLWKTRDKAEDTRDRAIRIGLPHVFCRSTAELNALYENWDLNRVDP